MASAKGSAASANIALEYFSAAAAPNSVPASSARHAGRRASSSKRSRPQSIGGTSNGSRKVLPMVAQNTDLAAPEGDARHDKTVRSRNGGRAKSLQAMK